MEPNRRIRPKALIFDWMWSDGAFVMLSDAVGSATNVQGHFVFSKEQFRELVKGNGGELRHGRRVHREDSVLPGWPETSLVAPIQIRNKVILNHIYELIIHFWALDTTKYHVTAPLQWWTCFVNFQSDAGMIGWMEETKGQIAFFYSQSEGRRILEMQKTLKPEVVKGNLEKLQHCGLPEVSTAKTTILGGPMATVLCGSHGLKYRHDGFRLIPKEARGDA